jgi:hypothetical protein
VGTGPRGRYYVQGYSGRKIRDVKIKPSRAQATLLQRRIGAKAVAPQSGSSFNTAQDASALRSGPVSVPSGSKGERDRLRSFNFCMERSMVQISADERNILAAAHSIFPSHRRLGSHVPYEGLVELRAPTCRIPLGQSHAIPRAFPEELTLGWWVECAVLVDVVAALEGHLPH